MVEERATAANAALQKRDAWPRAAALPGAVPPRPSRRAGSAGPRQPARSHQTLPRDARVKRHRGKETCPGADTPGATGDAGFGARLPPSRVGKRCRETPPGPAARPSAGTGRVPDEGRVIARSYDVSLALSRPVRSAYHALRTSGRAFPALLRDHEGREKAAGLNPLPAACPGTWRPPGPRSHARPPSDGRALL